MDRFIDHRPEQRLQALISQVFDEVHNRGRVSGMGAGVRSWRATFRADRSEIASFMASKGTALVAAILVVPLIAGSIATFGALPLAMLIGAAAGLLTQQLVSRVLHARDVNAILALIKAGENEDEVKSLNWAEVKPKLGGGDPQVVAEMAERIFAKMISDVSKLDDEIQAAREYGREHLDPTQMVAFLLRGEAHILESGGTIKGLPGRKHGSGVFAGLGIRDLSAKSGEFIDPTSRALHRLRRLRFYLRWLTEYMGLLEGAAIDAINYAGEAEEALIKAATIQVTAMGNHEHCGGVCFGPRDADLQFMPGAAIQPVHARYTHVNQAALETHRHAVPLPQGVGASLGNEAWRYNQLEGARSSAMTAALVQPVDKLLDEQAKGFIAARLTEVAGSAVGAWAGGFVGDAISAAMTQAVQRYRVSRPLQERVKLVRDAMQKNDAGQLDQAIADLAAANDLKAVLQAFLLAHSHYPTRIVERTKILRDALEGLRTNRTAGASPFPACENAATAVRYLVKVYHQAEKQAIHVLFVKFALEAIENKIFVEGYKRMFKPVVKEIANFDRSKLVHIDKTWETDPLAVQRHVGKLASRIKAEMEHARDAKDAAMRESNEVKRLSELAALRRKAATVFSQAAQLLGATYLNTAPFAQGRFREQTQPPELATSVLTMDEWRAASSIFMRPRSTLTLDLDRALEGYLRTLQGAVPGRGATAANAVQKTGLEKVARDLSDRAGKLRTGVHTQLNRWLTDKSGNAGSARRPAVQQLAAMVETELGDLEGAARACAQVTASGSELGLYS